MSKPSDSIEYHPLDGIGARASQDGKAPEILTVSQETSNGRHWLRTAIGQTIWLLWLAPVITLLVLNFTGYTIGPSLSCPNHDCQVEWFNRVTSVAYNNLEEFNKRDHNVLGVLQLVAKALEIWFEFIAAALVYLVTLRIAGRNDGIPIGLLTRLAEFSQLSSWLSKGPWRILSSMFGRRSASEHKFKSRIYFLFLASVLLCMICILMGPAIAVLVLPNLQWLTTQAIGNQTFSTLSSAWPPGTLNGSWLRSRTPYCQVYHLEWHEYSCMSVDFGPTLDAWVETAFATDSDRCVSFQEALTITFNSTSQSTLKNALVQQGTTVSDLVYWAPNRQTIDNLGSDFLVLSWQSVRLANFTSDDILTYNQCNNSLQTIIQRNGPVLGSMIHSYITYNYSNVSVTKVSETKQIRCYEGYEISLTPVAIGNVSDSFTKCIRVGQGWSESNRQTGFYVEGQYNVSTVDHYYGVSVDITTSDGAVFFANGIPPDWLPPRCLEPGQLDSNLHCDWDRVFQPNESHPLFNRTANITTIEMSMDDGYGRVATYTVDFVTFMAFATYELDASPLTNPLALVTMQDLESSRHSIYIDPNWLLAAWSADQNGILNMDRLSTSLLVNAMGELWLANNYSLLSTWYLDQLWLIRNLPIIQTMSMIDFTTAPAPPGTSADPAHPLLYRNARIYVRAYGLSSRTSKMGAAVAILGTIVVLIQFAVGLVDRRKYRSPVQLLIAALEHVPTGRFSGLEDDEAQALSVRFRVMDEEHAAGKLRFHAA